MLIVNMLEAKTSLSRLVDAVERGLESEVIIARNGRPAAKLVPYRSPVAGQRLGAARGLFVVPDSIDGMNAEVAHLLGAA